MSDRLSRWSPLIFACALVNFLAAQLLLLGGVAWPGATLFAGGTLVMVHLVTIGWLTLLIFGALFQFIPVITQHYLLNQRLSLVFLGLAETGLALMIAGFLLAGHGAFAPVLLPVGGGLVIAGILVGAVNIAVPLARKTPWPLSAWFIVAGLGFLLVTILLGLCFAVALTVPGVHSIVHSGALRLLAGGVEDHALAGIGGWFTLTAIGVSYELLPMFMLAPHERGALGTTIFWLCVSGFAVAVAAGIAAAFVPASAVDAPGIVGRVALLTVLAGILLYLADVVRLFRARKRHDIELHNRAAIGAFVCLGLGALWALFALADGRLGRDTPALVFLFLLGWLGGLGVTQLYKIVPFLAWLSWFGKKLGTGRVPRVQDLVNEKRSWPLFVLYFAGVLVATVAALVVDPLAIRAGVGLIFVATVLLAREFWRAWRAHYAATEAANPSPFPFKVNTKDSGHDGDRAARA
ncbi:MAG TPA: hypothetical protein VF286_02110 [Acidiphilium sp.]